MANAEYTFKKNRYDIRQTPADAGLAPLMPPDDLVEQWCKEAGFAGDDFHLSALQAFKERAAQKKDSELARFMPAQVPWSDCKYGRARISGHKDLGDGAYLTDLASFVREEGSGTALFTALLKSESPIELLAAALFNKAQVLYVPANAQGKHIELSNVLEKDELSAELLFLILGAGAEITINHVQRASRGIRVHALRGFIGAHARVTVISDRAYESGFYGISSEIWSLSKGSHLTSVMGLSGGKQTWIVKDFLLEDQTAEIEHISLMALKGDEQSALITRQQHKSSETKSSVLVKTLLMDQAHSFYRGTIIMNDAAEKSEADQQQRALVLGSSARTCAIPSLEVATHDVRCRHGSAAGRFNKEELWYLLSRGFDEQAAYALLIDGFYAEGLEGREVPGLVSMIERIKQRARFC